jgi:putative Ca2+/H+ antiporter (TMEM165/GDT1 family)
MAAGSRSPCARTPVVDNREKSVSVFLAALGLSFAVIFVAELGDKSQLMAMTFATRFKLMPTLIGITAATALVHLVSVGIGYGLGAAIPTDWISLVAGVAFLAFGAWTLRGDKLTDDEKSKAERSSGSAILAVGGAFFLAELGDKTMLATITLATQHGWVAVWIGSTVGMVAADALAIVVGRLLGRHLPEHIIKWGAAALFAIFGIWLIVEGVIGLS